MGTTRLGVDLETEVLRLLAVRGDADPCVFARQELDRASLLTLPVQGLHRVRAGRKPLERKAPLLVVHQLELLLETRAGGEDETSGQRLALAGVDQLPRDSPLAAVDMHDALWLRGAGAPARVGLRGGACQSEAAHEHRPSG